MQPYAGRFAIVLFSCLFLISCTSTKLTRTWTHPKYRGSQFSNVLVIGVAEKEEIRRSFEKKFVAKLKAAGIKAVKSLSVMSKDQKIEKETILPAVREIGADAVILTYLIGVKEKEVASPSASYTPPRDEYHGGSMYNISDYDRGPRHYTTRVKVRLETNLYDVKTEKKVWSARSGTLNPKSDTALMDSVIDALVKDLKKNKLLP